MPENGRLDGKVALVTGGCRGIGLGIVGEFAAQGATVIAADIERHDTELAPGVSFLGMDVAVAEDWERVRDELLGNEGRIDVLVNNAGIGDWADVVELQEETWERVIAVDQKSVWLGMKAVIPSMIAGSGGSIVNISSITGVTARPGIHAYHAAKGAVLSMTRNAAVTYATQGVRVNAIVPGFISTPLTDMQDPEISGEYIANTPMQRAGSPSDIAHAAVYLASDESGFVTGTQLVVDGGYLAY